MTPDPTEPTRYPTAAVELPLDPWLLEARPAPGCDVCGALNRQLRTALDTGDARTAYERAGEIRQHPHGAQMSLSFGGRT